MICFFSHQNKISNDISYADTVFRPENYLSKKLSGMSLQNLEIVHLKFKVILKKQEQQDIQM